MRNHYCKFHTGTVAFVRICLGLLCALALFAGTFYKQAAATAQVQTMLNARIVKHVSDCMYYYFDSPTAVYGNENGGITVADGANTYTFDTNNLSNAPDIRDIAPNTRKMTEYDGKRVTLASDILRVNDTILGNCVDFARLDNLLLCIDGNDPLQILAYDLNDAAFQQSPVETPALSGRAFKKIATDEKGVYLVTQSQKSKSWNDVHYAELDNSTLTVTQSFTVCSEIIRLEGMENGRLICHTRGLLTGYARTGKSFTKTGEFSCADAVTVSASADAVYGISDNNGIFMIDAALSARREILASAHDAKGFFRSNAGLASRKQMIAVADELNNRVQIITETDTKILNGSFVEPKAVAIDSAGNIYIAHAANKIAVYNANLTDTGIAYVAVSEDADITVTDMLFDSEDNLFILGDNGCIYKGTQFEALSGNTFTAMALSPTDNALYALKADNTVIRQPDAKTQLSVSLPDMPQTVSFCLDHDDSFYLLTETGNIVKYAQTAGQYARVTALPVSYAPNNVIKHAVKIVMNTVAFDRSLPLAYGDLLVSDTGAHAVKVIDGKQLEVNKDFAVNTEAPPIRDENLPNIMADKEIIFEVRDCEVYAQAAEINPLRFLRDGMRVIIPEFNADAPYTQIIADDLENGVEKDGKKVPPVTGFIRTSCIKNKKPIPYDAPPVGNCYSYFPTGVSVYKYPTLNASVPDTLEKNTRLALLPFIHINNAYGYADNRTVPAIWYRVAYEKNGTTYEGFVIEDSISIRGENPDDRNVYPRHNAKIIAAASLYERNTTGNIVVVSDDPFVPLKVNAKVEVVGTFDSSQEYTLIRYYHDGIGTLEFYVETVNIKYEGINRVHIVAIVLIVLTVILGIVLMIRYFHVKRTHKYNETKL